MLGLSFFLEEGVGLERYGVVEKAGRFLCGSSSPLAWKPHSSLLAHPPLTAPPPPPLEVPPSPRGWAAASLCCFSSPRPLPSEPSMRSASRARQQHQHQHQDPKPRSLGAPPRAGSRPAARARRSLPRLRILSPGGSPRSRRSGRARRGEGGASGEVPSWRSHWDPPRLFSGGSGRA